MLFSLFTTSYFIIQQKNEISTSYYDKSKNKVGIIPLQLDYKTLFMTALPQRRCLNGEEHVFGEHGCP
jgi:hypothetical protein